MRKLLHVFVVVMTVGGCPGPIIDDIFGRLDESIVAALDEARAALSQTNADIASILSELQRAIGEDSLTSELRDVLEYGAGVTVASANEGIQCQLDALRQRAIEIVDYIEARLRGRDPTLPPPLLCGAFPREVDLSRDPDSWRSVNLWGYGLGNADDGRERFGYRIAGSDVPIPVANISNYSATLNLSSEEVQSALYETGAGQLEMTWNGAPLGNQGEISVLRWQPGIEPDFQPESWSSSYTPSCGGDSNCGDREFDNDDGPATLTFRAQPIVSDDRRKIFVEVTEFRAREVEDDRTMLLERGRDVRPIYSAPDGYEIVSFQPTGAVTVNRTVAEDECRNRVCRIDFSGGAINRLELWLSTSGQTDAGSYTRYRYRVRALELQLRQTRPDWLGN